MHRACKLLSTDDQLPPRAMPGFPKSTALRSPRCSSRHHPGTAAPPGRALLGFPKSPAAHSSDLPSASIASPRWLPRFVRRALVLSLRSRLRARLRYSQLHFHHNAGFRVRSGACSFSAFAHGCALARPSSQLHWHHITGTQAFDEHSCFKCSQLIFRRRARSARARWCYLPRPWRQRSRATAISFTRADRPESESSTLSASCP